MHLKDPCSNTTCEEMDGTRVSCHAFNKEEFECHYECLTEEFFPIKDNASNGCVNPCQTIGCNTVQTDQIFSNCDSLSVQDFVCNYQCCSQDKDCQDIL